MATVAYCCTMHNEEDIAYWHLLYYYKVGIRDFFIQFNTADDTTRLMVQLFERDHDVNIHTYHNKDRSYEGFPSRKMKMYRTAGQAGFDWILPLDADELITTQNRDLRHNFNLPDFLNKHYDYLKPNQYMRFKAYKYAPTQKDSPFNPNPFDRIRYRTDVFMAKSIWRYGEGTVFRGAHNVVNAERARKQGPKPMTAHFPLRTPIQVIKKHLAFAQCALHQYTQLPNPDNLPDPNYNPYKGKFTSRDTEGSIQHQFGKAKRGHSLLSDLSITQHLLQDLAQKASISDPVWKDTFS